MLLTLILLEWDRLQIVAARNISMLGMIPKMCAIPQLLLVSTTVTPTAKIREHFKRNNLRWYMCTHTCTSD